MGWFKKKENESKSSTGNMVCGFILFNSIEVDWEAFYANLEKDWNIKLSEKQSKDSVFAFEVDGMSIACTFIDLPIPHNEAENNARNNFLWKEAMEVTSTHKAHAILAVMNGSDAIERNLLFTKIACSLLKLDNAIGIYQSPTVIPSKFYIDVAEDIKQGYLPILNWIYFGIYPDGDRVSGYTVGLNKFGKDEIEVIKTKESPKDLYNFLVCVASYVVEGDVTLKHGETIGFSQEQKLKIIRSKGIAVEGESIKIEF
ncbi:MAG TPA: DUF4261 domain-containing protein [Acetivibrio clariflavus]|nr:DUF4261 domain-containing protein [Acetivibrio clariflavus]HPU40985.1 DUF4261 domain-containing protein [Acetivibrio clariflavus]